MFWSSRTRKSQVARLATLWVMASIEWAVAGAPKRFGFDPLSNAEISRAVALVRGAGGAEWADASRVEPLLVLRSEPDDSAAPPVSWPRRADVVLYHYDRDEILRAVVNLGTAAVEQSSHEHGTNLPITFAETARALELALVSEQTGATIRRQYRRWAGKTFVASEQLDPQAKLFRPPPTSDEGWGDAAACRHHRCASLLVATPGGRLLDVAIVDLVASKVIKLE